MKIFLTADILLEQKNIKNKINNLVKVNTINYKNNLGYLSIVNNFIYFKQIDVNNTTKRFNISNPLEPIEDISFGKNYGIASHNMYFFNDKQGKVKAIGGQHYGIGNFQDDLKKNNNYANYHSKISFIDSRPYQISMGGCHAIYNHTEPCPYYANGLHLFAEVNDNLICLNNKLPIVSGVHPGRYDGHYGYTNNCTLESCRNGLTVYDSLGSIVYNKEKDLYFMYHRANIGTGRRSIQYTTSKNLLEWSEFNIVNFGPSHDYFGCNMYYSNFFNVPNTNIYLGIIPYIRRLTSDYGSFDTKEEYRLYYSYDCINYTYVGNIHENIDIKSLENFRFATNLPYYFNNNMYFYITNDTNMNMDIYKLVENRYFCITNTSDDESFFTLKLEFNIEQIILNLVVRSNGYLYAELLDVNNIPIEEYSFNEFEKINNIDDINYILKWKNKIKIPSNSVFISFKFKNAEIYSIE